MVSSLGYAILALLASKPQSGYDLSKQMKAPLGLLWQATHGQIYPELSRLARLGYVSLDRVDQRSGPPRRVHTITSTGRAELTRWAAEPPQARPANDEFVVKAYAYARVPRNRAVAMLEDQISGHQQRLAALEHMAEALVSKAQPRLRAGMSRFGEFAALRRAIGMEREYIAWGRWLLAELQAAPSAAAKKPPRTLASRRGRRARPRAGVKR
jgi:DNA-binding PadR family transcriptional regulator